MLADQRQALAGASPAIARAIASTCPRSRVEARTASAVRAFSRRPRLPDPRLQLQEPGVRDLRQREIGVGGERPLQPGIGPGGGRQQQIDRRDVIGDRLGRGCGHRELETVGHPHLHDSPCLMPQTTGEGSPGQE